MQMNRPAQTKSKQIQEHWIVPNSSNFMSPCLSWGILSAKCRLDCRTKKQGHVLIVLVICTTSSSGSRSIVLASHTELWTVYFCWLSRWLRSHSKVTHVSNLGNGPYKTLDVLKKGVVKDMTVMGYFSIIWGALKEQKNKIGSKKIAGVAVHQTSG